MQPQGRYHMEFHPPFHIPADAPHNGQAQPWVQKFLTTARGRGAPASRQQQRILLLAPRDRTSSRPRVRCAPSSESQPAPPLSACDCRRFKHPRGIRDDGITPPLHRSTRTVSGPGWSWPWSPPGRSGTSSTSRRPRRRIPGRRAADLQPRPPAGLPAGRAGRHDRPGRPLRFGGRDRARGDGPGEPRTEPGLWGRLRWPSALAAAGSPRRPAPTFDGWHGLGWRAIFDPGAPTACGRPGARGGLASRCWS